MRFMHYLFFFVWVCKDADRTEEVKKTKPDVNSDCVSSRSAPESSGRHQHANTCSRERETGASEAGNTHIIFSVSFKKEKLQKS